MKEFEIKHIEEGSRLDKWLGKMLPQAGSGFIYKMLRKKNITLNASKATGKEVLKEGDVVRVFFSDGTFEKFSAGSGVSAGRGTSDGESGDKTGNGKNAAKETGSGRITVSFGGKVRTLSEKPALDMRKLRVLYEDKDVLVIDKPAGVLSQKAGPSDVSVNEYLLEYMTSQNLLDPAQTTFRPAACHRLDRNTSGILVCGISNNGLKTMSDILKDRSIRKEYLCLVRGLTEDRFVLRDYLTKDKEANQVSVTGATAPGAVEAVLEGETLARSGGMSLVKIHLVTGRSHQIRVQMSHAGHPVLGDRKYGDERVCGISPMLCERHIKRPMLHSYSLTFPDGLPCGPTGCSLIAPVPADMLKIMKGADILWEPGNPEA